MRQIRHSHVKMGRWLVGSLTRRRDCVKRISQVVLQARRFAASTITSTDIQTVRAKIPHVMASFVDGGSSRVLLSNEQETGGSHNNLLHYTNLSPATGEALCQIQVPSAEVVDAAVKSSHAAYHLEWWSLLSIQERGNVLGEMANRMKENSRELSILEALDTGLPISQIQAGHIPAAIQTLEYYAGIGASGGLPGRILDVPHAGGHQDSISFTRREPLGVCVGIGGWNYPIVTMAWKLAPCLIMGNSLIYKPSECTPLTSLWLAEKWKDILPPGVLQVLPGDGVVAQQLVDHERIAKVSITGSTQTGIKVAKSAANTLKRTTLELGGKSALLIFDDCNLESAVRVAAEANFINNGQVCSNATRVFVQNSVKEEFTEKLRKRLQSTVQMGNPLHPETNMGPMMMHPHEPSQHYNRVMGFLERAKQDPAIKVLYGGSGYHDNESGGYFVEPTVLLAKDDTPEIVREEVFGPIMTVLAFDTEEEAVERANSSEYGLGAGVMTKDVMRAHRLTKNLEAGNVWINNWNLTPVEMPFGPYKMSGYGHELGTEALEHFSRTKMVYMEMGDVQEGDTFF